LAAALALPASAESGNSDAQNRQAVLNNVTEGLKAKPHHGVTRIVNINYSTLTKAGSRAYWVATLDRIARPVLSHLAAGTLKASMPVEQKPKAGREAFSHLEAFGRTVCGIAPWLGVAGLTGTEAALQAQYRQLALAALDKATDPQSPDFLNFSTGGQALVDTAFLAQGLLRAPDALWTPLPGRVKANVINALKASRGANTPDHNNWVMFAATVEAALLTFGETPQADRLQDNVHKMLGWYAGDGAYGDGAFFHFDYYNSLVIHPMLVDVLGVLARHDPAFAPILATEMTRATRYAAVLERLIAPDGTFPSIGRSQAYRFGAFQLLGQMALLKALPEHVAPAQVRGALTAVIHRVTEAPGTFDKGGWLTIGFCGHQPDIGEDYISTGSLYMCTAAFLALGLAPSDPFWSSPAAPWTQVRLWAGENLPADHAIADVRL
jgi:hypothetical protein